MRQRIIHGGTIDAATPDETAHIIAEAFSRQQTVEYTRERGAVNLDSNGIGQDVLNVSSQYDWLLERVTCTGAAGALIGLYENEATGSALLEVIGLGAAGMYSDGFSNRIHVPANTRLLLTCVGGDANGQFTYNLQIRLMRRKQT